MASNERLRELAEQAVNWLHALAPKAANAEREAEVRKLADDLYNCVKGCPACGGPDPTCPCERDE